MAEDIGMCPTLAGVPWRRWPEAVKEPSVYILASKPRGTLYVGVTSDLIKRVWQHREDVHRGFTSRYGVKTLVWYEQHRTMISAIARENSIKRLRRREKFDLIVAANRHWRDLWYDIIGDHERSPTRW